MALGAPRVSVMSLVVGQGVSLACIGMGTGDPMTLASVTGLLIYVWVAACIIPARRATRVDPLIALRNE